MNKRISGYGLVIACITIVSTFIGCKSTPPDPGLPPVSVDLFRNPPLEARPGALWPWMNGYVDRQQLVYELEQMKAKGMRGPYIWDIGTLADKLKMIPVGPKFLDKESLESIRLVMDEGQRLGLDIGFFASSSWNAGGSWIKPEDGSKAILSSEVVVQGPAPFHDTLPDPKGKTDYFKEIAVYAVPIQGDGGVTLNEIIDISAKFDGKMLQWEVPAGSWRILRFLWSNTGQPLMCPSPNSSGLMIDHLSAKAAESHIKYMLDQIQGDRKDFGGLTTFMLDSYEVDPANDWTPDFVEQFKQLLGYDPLPYLPVLAGVAVGSPEISKRFEHDYRKAVGEMIYRNHFVREKEILNARGLKLLAEAGHGGYPRVDPLKALGVADIPMGEFWNGMQFWVTKEAASAAHIYGNNLVNAESLTGWRAWRDGPAHYKRLFDVALCEGLNQVTFHAFSHNPKEAGLPGFVYHAGEHFNVNTTWWEYSGPMLKYMSRASYMLQQGQFVGDLCLYYGDHAPNLVPPRRIDPTMANPYDSSLCGHCGVPKPVNTTGLGIGYDYDYINEDVILSRMELKNGRFTLPKDLSYSLMVLPDTNVISPAVLKKLETFIRAGGVVFGPKPVRSNSLQGFPECDQEVKRLGDRIWGDCDGNNVTSHTYGKGKVYYGLPLWKVMHELGIPRDFDVPGIDWSDRHIDYIHRRTAEEDIYFVSNSTLEHKRFNARFRIPEGCVPLLWFADDGSIRRPQKIEAGAQFTNIELDLPPVGSVFVVFTSPEKAAALLSSPGTPAVNGPVVAAAVPALPWKVSFPQERGGPGQVEMKELADWSLSAVEGVRYFSGTATYASTLEVTEALLKENGELRLDLGEVREVAVVYLNGTAVDTLWKPPYVTTVTKWMRSGTNQLEISVTNLWHNRLVGDAGKPVAQRFTRTNIQDRYKPNMPLLPSGLIGPVVLFTQD